MFLTLSTPRQVNHPTQIVKEIKQVAVLETTVHAQKQEATKIPIEQPKPTVVTSTQTSSGTCESWMQQAGIPITYATKTLIINESGCRHTAVNPTSGACGIPQALPCSKMGPVNADGTSAVSPIGQLQWMDNYIKQRYTTWENALSFWHCIGRCTNNYGTITKTATWY